jgi:uncharacterized protein
MLTLEQVRARRDEILRLAKAHRASNVRVFGSVARGTAGPESDLDILIDTEPGCSLFDLGGLLEDLKDLFGPRVDLVVADGLKERAKPSVLRDAVQV